MRRINFAALVAMFLFGGALHAQETLETVECPPDVFPGTYVSEDDTYYFGRGDSPARIVESYASSRWQGFISLNPYLEERLSYNVTVGDRTYEAYAEVAVCEPLQGLRELGLVPADLADEEPATIPVVTPISLVEVEQAAAGINWWILLFMAVFAIAISLLYKYSVLKTDFGDTDEQLRQERDRNGRLERQFAKQRQDDFVARRNIMPLLPDGVEDGVLAGPPMRPEGVTRENRNEVFDEAARAAYQQLHSIAAADDLTFEQQNVRRVLVSSRPNETFRMTFRDYRSREVKLMREPGWIFDAVIRRGDEVIQRLEDICVIGSCANTFEYQRSWIIGALIEPYEQAAIHSVPDWKAVEAKRASHLLVIRSADGGCVTATLGEGPPRSAPSIIIHTENDDVSEEEFGFSINNRIRLVAGQLISDRDRSETKTETEEESTVTA